MLVAENYTVAVFEKYFIYFQGLLSTITENFGTGIKAVQCDINDLDTPSTIEYPVDLILFHIPLYMPLRRVKQLVKRMKERHHEASIILYCGEKRDDIAKNVVSLGVKASFLLEHSVEDITNEIGKVLHKKNTNNFMIKMD